MSFRHALGGAALLATGLLAGSLLQPAQAQSTKVTCAQVIQHSTGFIDEAMVAKFMSEQLDAGRTRFQTVQGLSTVLCAY